VAGQARRPRLEHDRSERSHARRHIVTRPPHRLQPTARGTVGHTSLPALPQAAGEREYGTGAGFGLSVSPVGWPASRLPRLRSGRWVPGLAVAEIDWRKLEARLNMYRLHARYLHEEVLLRAEQCVPTFDPIDVPPADAARLVRMQWRMPVGPAQTLVQWLEAAGCIVIEEDFGRATRVDGLSQWVDECPVVLLNAHAPTDRKRLTLAHELGHLCLHSEHVAEDMEDQANAFAAEFLMPASMIRPQLRNLSLGRLLDLKREWGVPYKRWSNGPER
jgi:IrrE N-terminal-like domain